MELVREIADTGRFERFDGEPLVQSFRVPGGYVWITTAEALTVPGFGRPWVEARVRELQAELGPRGFARGVRLRAEAPAALALAA
ncbi:MAG TPA: hypothetical protein VFG79_09710 [Solirubrobacter sp.]|nr:hypothetical protein [Solirubrobacter sp.]